MNKTDVPLFFLFTQLIIAVVLFAGLHVSGFLFRMPEKPMDMALLKGLAPMVILGVVNLKYVLSALFLWRSRLPNGSNPQPEQLHLEIRRRLILPSRPRSRPPIHRRSLLHNAPPPPVAAHHGRHLHRHRRIPPRRRHGLGSRRHDHDHSHWSYLRCSLIRHHRPSGSSHQAGARGCWWKRDGPVLVQQRALRLHHGPLHRFGW